jgi:hypothetical protein
MKKMQISYLWWAFRSKKYTWPMSTPLATPLEAPELEELGSVLTEERTSNFDDGDHEKFAHYVEKNKIVESAVTGSAVKALCGKKWTPNRDPSKFPICPDCEKIHKSLPKGGD